MAYEDIIDGVTEYGLSGFTAGAIASALLTSAGAGSLLGIPVALFLPVLTIVGVLKGIGVGQRKAKAQGQ